MLIKSCLFLFLLCPVLLRGASEPLGFYLMREPIDPKKSILPNLTEAERNWLEQHPVIRVSFDPYYPPYEYLDSDLIPRGYNVAIAQAIMKRTGIAFAFNRDYPWTLSKHQLFTGESDLTLSSVSIRSNSSTNEFRLTEDARLLTLPPLIQNPVAILSCNRNVFVPSFENISTIPIAVQRGDVLTAYLEAHHPYNHYVYFNTLHDVTQSLIHGEKANAYIGDFLVLATLVADSDETTGLQITSGTPMLYCQSIAVRKDWPLLKSILLKVQQTFTEEDYYSFSHVAAPPPRQFNFLWNNLKPMILGLCIIAAVILIGLIFYVLHATRTAKSLAQGYLFLSSAVDQFREGVTLVNADGVIVYCNAASAALSGLHPDHLINTTSPLFHLLKNRLAWSRNMMDTLARGETWTGQGAFSLPKSPNNNEIISVTPIRTAQGVQHYLLLRQDISGQLQADAELEHIRKQLSNQHELEGLGRMIGGIVHDFNNVLQSIMGNAELATLDIPDTPDNHSITQDLKMLVEVVKQTSNLTRLFLVFSRTDDASTATAIDINTFIPNFLKLLNPFREKNIHFTLDLAPAPINVQITNVYLEQIISNLCLNSFDAITHDHGEVSLRLKRISFPAPFKTSISTLAPGTYARITLTDNGCGIPPNLIHQIFQPFFSVKSHDTNKQSGLGLFIVYGILMRYKGGVIVDSTLGKGATFTVFLPVAKDPTATGDSPTALPKGGVS